MKKILALLLAVVMMLSIGVGCTPKEDAEAPADAETPAEEDASLQAVLDKGYIILGLDDTFAPMGFRDENNEIVGFDIDLAKEVAERLGVELRLQPIEWDSKVLELQSGNIDMIWNGLTITEERKENINFSKPYFNDRQVIIVLNESPVNTKADLEGTQVGVQIESTAAAAVEADAEFAATLEEVVQYSSFNEVYMGVQSGILDAMVVDELSGRYAIGKNPGIFRVLEDTYGDEQIGIGFRKGEDALRDKIDEILDEMAQDGSGAAISEKWFGEDVFSR
ncbi:amino acid ABC transporter substrate-binding protein, PAAT family [Dethiosulfatibacter aminovorans DSM 17477]|uniref:Amino acid ABC transporter substrate-binding protein, PAAT family n=1 Tax=Dethiosulfatibacter aminovorans DSM 17477 TaxID=1121476 RepID=A0A1M6LMZ1_9FIRM|nr:amino acid ABC transporter substrate-binding protein [Dethiosulfatibacter aminovorans]SHJ72571.1 amino acid ABC transporter substrate-binding protein, PAAT family [Dethiosulfatibacter aminovorans DSM 17477]